MVIEIGPWHLSYLYNKAESNAGESNLHWSKNFSDSVSLALLLFFHFITNYKVMCEVMNHGAVQHLCSLTARRGYYVHLETCICKQNICKLQYISVF